MSFSDPLREIIFKVTISFEPVGWKWKTVPSVDTEDTKNNRSVSKER